MCKIDPKIDIAFKKLFGSEENKDLLISLINSVLPETEQIKSIILENPYNLASYISDKMSILDIKATDENGKVYDIEMQMGQQGYFGQRALYYWGKSYTNQLEKSGKYSTLKKTIIISIFDFEYFNDSDRYHRAMLIKDRDSNEIYSQIDFLEMHFVELPKFHKDISSLQTALDRWITFLTKAKEFEKGNIPKELEKFPEIKKAIEALDTIYLNDKERQIYEAEQKEFMDEKGKIQFALKENSLEIAKNFKELNAPIDMIIKATGLSKTEIEKL